MSTNAVNGFDLPSPKVTIPRDVYTKIMWWVAKASPSECSGLGKTIIDGNEIKIVDAWMVKQKNTGSTTDMDDEAVAQLLYDKRDVPGNMNFWWHSHANMDVFWSGTDKQQINKIAQNGMCVAVVFNNAKKARGCVAISQPVHMHIDDVKVVVEEPYDKSMTSLWDSEFDGAVQKYVAPTRSFSGYDSAMGYRSEMYDHVWPVMDGGSELTRKPVGFEPSTEDPKAARIERLSVIDHELEVLEKFFDDAIQSQIAPVSAEIKKILGLSHVSIENPHQDFELTAGKQANFYELAWEKSIELDEELAALRGKTKYPTEVHQ